ncbi:MAG: hypothetical protein FJW23_04585, partial [Acidimicrobiia bacterium]|nr:hypothetical protein [Acidimicrobiia bacterium]
MRRLLAVAVTAAMWSACGGPEQAGVTQVDVDEDAALARTLTSYAVEFLRRNPSVNSWLGGAGLDQSLRAVDGRLRDHSPASLIQEDQWLDDVS